MPGSIHWRSTTALIAKLVIFRYFISTHGAKHVKIIKLNAQVNNKWQKSGESTVTYAIMAPFKIFDSAHAQPEFFRAVTVIADVCRVEFCLILSFVSNIYICYLPDGRSVLEKYFVEVSKTAEGRGTFLRPRQNIFLVRTDLNGK